MRSLFEKAAVMVLAALMLVGTGGMIPQDVRAESVRDIQINVRYGQTEAREMLASINEFRTGSDAWAWDQSNTNKVQYSGLGTLTYDYELERIAMQRAAEIAISFSHTRPDGTSCFTAYSSGFRSAMGENIAYGYPDQYSVYMGWREDDDDYSGQGHRRNMLSSNFKSIGIGHAIYNGVDCWVQEFSGSIVDTNAVAANDSKTTVTISAVESIAKNFDKPSDDPSGGDNPSGDNDPSGGDNPTGDNDPSGDDDPYDGDDPYDYDDPDDEAWEQYEADVNAAKSLVDNTFTVKAKAGKKITVSLSPLSSSTAYQIRYTTDKKFKKNVKKQSVKAGAKTATLKKLKAKKTYYIQIRPITAVTDMVFYDTEYIPGKWSGIRQVKTKK